MENKNIFLFSVSDFDVLSMLFCLKQVEYKVIVKEVHCSTTEHFIRVLKKKKVKKKSFLGWHIMACELYLRHLQC